MKSLRFFGTALCVVITNIWGMDTALAQFPVTPLSIDKIPAGESITITYEVTVDDPIPVEETQVSSQGNVTGNNLAAVPTDDPDTAPPADPTVTPLQPLPSNTPPVAMKDTVTVFQGDSLKINVLANDFDAEGNIDSTCVMIVTGPINGTAVADTVTGEISYVPTFDFVGQDSILYAIKDSLGAISDTTCVIIHVESTDLVVYDDALNDWIDMSWTSEIWYGNTEKTYQGSASAIKVQSTNWGALSMHYGERDQTQTVDPSYKYLNFAICAIDKGFTLQVTIENDAHQRFPKVIYGTINPSDGWVNVSVPISSLNPNGLKAQRIAIRANTSEQRTFFVDDVRFIKPPEPPPGDGKKLIVYDNSLNGWINASWTSTVNFGSAEKTYDNSSHAIKVQSRWWGALSVHYGNWGQTKTVDPSMKYLNFVICAVDQPFTLQVSLENDRRQRFNRVIYGEIKPSDGWVRVSVPIADLNPNNFDVHRLAIRANTSRRRTYFVDDIHFTDGVPQVATRRVESGLVDAFSEPDVPTVFSLAPNRPNPFNPSTTIAYEVPEQTHVLIVVYNILGQEVVRLVDGMKSAGRYSVAWNGRNKSRSQVSSGVYVYRMSTGTGFVKVQRMTLLK